MKIYHVKNSYLYDKQDLNGTHRYAHGIDKRNKEYLVRITHLYDISSSKKKQLKNGLIKKYKLKNSKLPIGIGTRRIYKDIDGNPITLNSRNSKICREISKRDQKNIINISNTTYKKYKKMATTN